MHMHVSITGVCILIGVTIFGAKHTPSASSLHYSFGLCTTAGILCLLCAGLLFIDFNTARREGEPAGVKYASQGRVLAPPPGAQPTQPQQPVQPGYAPTQQSQGYIPPGQPTQGYPTPQQPPQGYVPPQQQQGYQGAPAQDQGYVPFPQTNNAASPEREPMASK